LVIEKRRASGQIKEKKRGKGKADETVRSF